MTVIEPYTAECSECGYSETRMGLMSFNSMVGIPEGLIEEHPVGCPKCGDVGFDVYDEEDKDDETQHHPIMTDRNSHEMVYSP